MAFVWLPRLKELGGFEAIDRHACSLSSWLRDCLKNLKHWNGEPACRVFDCCSSVTEIHLETLSNDQRGFFDGVVGQGPIVTFNLLSSKGQWVGVSEFHRLALLHNIHLRVGRFCNYGKRVFSKTSL